jgi:hypothetical protein
VRQVQISGALTGAAQDGIDQRNERIHHLEHVQGPTRIRVCGGGVASTVWTSNDNTPKCLAFPAS